MHAYLWWGTRRAADDSSATRGIRRRQLGRHPKGPQESGQGERAKAQGSPRGAEAGEMAGGGGRDDRRRWARWPAARQAGHEGDPAKALGP